MIISLRGTSGAGKSHLVRRIMELYPNAHPEFVEFRAKPLYTVHSGRVAILGHYEIANGGVDTIRRLGEAYALASDLYMRYHVLMEGKNMSDGVKQVMALTGKGYDIHVVHIDTPVDKCIESVRSRGHSIAERSIIRTHRKVLNDLLFFRKYKVNVFQGSRDECFEYVKELLCTDLS